MKFDRIEAAVKGEEVDEVPVSVWRHFPGRDLEAGSLCESSLAFQRRFDPDLMKVCPSGGYASIAWGAEIEYYGSPTGATRTRVHRIRELEDWGTLERLDVSDSILGEMTSAIECIGRAIGGEIPYIQTVFSPLTICYKIAGGRFMGDIKEDPLLVSEGLRVVSRTMVDFSKASLDAGASGIFFATQMATTNKLTDDEYRRFGLIHDLPILKAVKKAFFNTVHIHGENIMFDLIANNYPAHSLNWHDQRTLPNLMEASKRFKGALMGGINEVGTLLKGS